MSKIIDFGLCRFIDERRERLSLEAFTRMYRPPEVLLGDARYGEAADIWSVGAIVAELFILHPIFRSISPELMTFGNKVREDESDFGQVLTQCVVLVRYGPSFLTPVDEHFLMLWYSNHHSSPSFCPTTVFFAGNAEMVRPSPR